MIHAFIQNYGCEQETKAYLIVSIHLFQQVARFDMHAKLRRCVKSRRSAHHYGIEDPAIEQLSRAIIILWNCYGKLQYTTFGLGP